MAKENRITTTSLAEVFGVTPQTIRNRTRTFASLLRLDVNDSQYIYNNEDTIVMILIHIWSDDGVSSKDILSRLTSNADILAHAKANQERIYPIYQHVTSGTPASVVESPPEHVKNEMTVLYRQIEALNTEIDLRDDKIDKLEEKVRNLELELQILRGRYDESRDFVSRLLQRPSNNT